MRLPQPDTEEATKMAPPGQRGPRLRHASATRAIHRFVYEPDGRIRSSETGRIEILKQNHSVNQHKQVFTLIF